MANHPETAALEPNLVAEVELVDPTNLIFHVRRGINFHNGTPYTAEDLAFNWERVSAAAEYHLGGETSDHPNGWATARMTFGTVNFASYGLVDDYTVRVETPAPDASLVASVTGGAVVQHSKAYVEANGDEHVDTVNTVGTGPFQLAEHIPDVGIKYTRYEGYHKDPRRAGRAAAGLGQGPECRDPARTPCPDRRHPGRRDRCRLQPAHRRGGALRR